MVEALLVGWAKLREDKNKKKKDLSQIWQILFLFAVRVNLLPHSAKGAGVWGLRRPKGFFVLFWLQKRTSNS